MDEQLKQRLAQAKNLPTLPAVAMRITELARDPDADLGQVADAISNDPALVAKVLRIANSPFYALRRRCDNLRQALTFLGINGTLALALSFSLLRAFRDQRHSGLDHEWFWRRSLIAAASSRVLAERLAPSAGEELFLGALLQDIGMLALDSAVADFYAPLRKQPSAHQLFMTHEHAQLGTDHAAVGAWLLELWHLPDHIQKAAAGSHEPESVAEGEPLRTFVRCVCIAGHMADAWIAEEPAGALQRLKELALSLLGLEAEEVEQALSAVAEQLPEIESLFEIDLGDTRLMESILEEAKEAQVLQNLQLLREASDASATKESLELRTRQLEEQSRRDPLTGLYNRGHLDRVLREEFEQAQRHRWPLSVVFADLDHFKGVNDAHGHQAGDGVLAAAAQLLVSCTRGGDVIARYGGEEFVIVLPGSGSEGARVVCARLVDAFARTHHAVGEGESVVVTASVGVATHGEAVEFQDVSELIRAADRALYTAKLAGRNRLAEYEPDKAGHVSGARFRGSG